MAAPGHQNPDLIFRQNAVMNVSLSDLNCMILDTHKEGCQSFETFGLDLIEKTDL